jgi:hypothetical protein
VYSAPHGALHQSGPLERLDVLGCRRERHPIGGRELGHCLLAPGEPLEHRTTSAIAEGPKDHVEPRFTTFNHVVEYIAVGGTVNPSVE